MRDPNRKEPDPSFVFYEDDIIALQELDANELYVPLARLRANLGIVSGDSADLIEGHSVLAAGVRSLGHDGPGLRVDLVPLWLLLIPAASVRAAVRTRLLLFQRECASVLWQGFKPQGFGPEDALLPPRDDMTPADQAYQGMMAQAALARQQVLIERHLMTDVVDGNRIDVPQQADRTGAAFDLARAVRRVAHTLAARSRRNEYGGVFSGLYRQFGISSYRHIPYGRLREAMDWLERWHSDMLGEPEPPPDI